MDKITNFFGYSTNPSANPDSISPFPTAPPSSSAKKHGGKRANAGRKHLNQTIAV
jgi:hypothetical protein